MYLIREVPPRPPLHRHLPMSPSPSRSVMIVFLVLGGLAWHVSDRRNSFSFSTWLLHWASLPKSHPCDHDVRLCSFLGLPGTPRSPYRSISTWIVYLLDLVFPWWTLGLGREVGEGFRIGNMCTPVADSCWCMAKPIQYCKLICL